MNRRTERQMVIHWLESIAFNHSDFASQMRALKILRELFGIVYAS